MIGQLLKTAIKRQVQDSLSFRLPKVSVKVNQGTVTGVIEHLPDGRTYQRFSGIPFAKPPVGELRFRAPQKLMKFDRDKIDCSREANQCLQKSLFYKIYVGSEDCLNLNVYVPNNVEKIKKLPVMIWIHGGAFSFGSNSRDLYSPEFLLMENVIVVTLNYRLHVLGFAYVPEMGINGNAGLKDQQMGLEWVHENIEYFGGDRDNVTLFGESAGAVSAHLHSLNKKSRKHFNKMILQSSSAICEWILQADPREKMKRIVQNLNGRTSSPKDIYDCLMKTDAKKLFENRLKCCEDYEKRRSVPTYIKPCIEIESDDAFLTKLPVDIIRAEGASIKIPMIHGLNVREGLFQVEHCLRNIDHINKNISDFIPTTLNIRNGTKESVDFGNEMKKFYCGDQEISKESLSSFVDLCTDLHFNMPTTMINDLYNLCGSPSQKFFYTFEIESRLNIAKSMSKLKHLPGVYHTDEVAYLFDYKIFGFKYPECSNEWKYRERMCKLWTNFAKFTDPTPDDDNMWKIKWDQADATSKLNYLRITNQGICMRRGLHENRVEFWQKAFEKYNGGFTKPIYQVV